MAELNAALSWSHSEEIKIVPPIEGIEINVHIYTFISTVTESQLMKHRYQF